MLLFFAAMFAMIEAAAGACLAMGRVHLGQRPRSMQRQPLTAERCALLCLLHTL